MINDNDEFEIPESEYELGEDIGDMLGDEGDEEYAEGGDSVYEHFRFTADGKQSPLRIDKFLVDRLAGVSRNRIQAAADANYILANGKPVKSNYKVKPYDIIQMMYNRPRYDNEIIPGDIPLNIVYGDDSIIVVNKPAGLVVHPGCGNYSGTLVNGIAWHLRDDPYYDPNDPGVGLVHRIDKDTSGLLVVAKTIEAKTFLAMQFYNKTTKREYNALVWGNIEEDKGTIVGNIARNPNDRMQMTVFDPESGIGKHAVTHYEVLERFGYVTFVKCVLETGRTHQIRAHMKHIGHPLFADTRYGGNVILRGNQSSSYRQFIANSFDVCSRQVLHAKTLGFQHPITHEDMFFTSELPDDIVQLLDRWRTYMGAKKDNEN